MLSPQGLGRLIRMQQSCALAARDCLHSLSLRCAWGRKISMETGAVHRVEGRIIQCMCPALPLTPATQDGDRVPLMRCFGVLAQYTRLNGGGTMGV